MKSTSVKCDWPECNRLVTEYFGEFGDHQTCYGHRIIMQSNYESHCLPMAADGSGNFSFAELNAWRIERRKGNKWLKENPNPTLNPEIY